MASITIEDANAWADKYKLEIGELDSDLESSVSTQVLAAVSQTYDVGTWVDPTMTPALVRKIIAMKYMGWLFQRTYSEDDDVSTYGILLMGQADNLLAGIVGGDLLLSDSGQTGPTTMSRPVFYPTDASSAAQPSYYDKSLGGSKFQMGKIF